MIDDLIKLIHDRFLELNNINVVYHLYSSTIIIDVIGDYNMSVINIRFSDDSVFVIPACGTFTSVHVVRIFYDDFTDVDEFVGSVLARVFYG